jgi:hypothetical protein
MTAPSPLTPAPRSLSTRGWIALGLVIALVVLAYVLVARFYNAEGGIKVTGGNTGTQTAQLTVSVEPLSVDALGNNATMRFIFDSQDQSVLSSDGRLSKNIRVTVSSPEGSQEFKFPAGTLLGRAEALVGTNGQVATYPFDSHGSALALVIDTYEREADGTFLSQGGVTFETKATGGVNGWDTELVLPDTVTDGAILGVNFQRAFSTQVFAILMISLGLILASLAFFVGILVATNRRKMEVALLPWTASLLFALPLLRTYLPNSPPIGASIDIYVYLWVIAMAVTAAVLVIFSWMNQGRAQLEINDQVTTRAS